MEHENLLKIPPDATDRVPLEQIPETIEHLHQLQQRLLRRLVAAQTKPADDGDRLLKI